MKMNNEKILQQLQSAMSASIGNHNEVMARVNVWNAEIEAESTIYSAGSSKAGDAGMVSKDIKKSIESALPSLVEPYLNRDITMIQGQDAQSDAKAEKIQKLLNYQWNYGTNALPFMERLVRDMMSDGTVILKSGWDSDNDVPRVEVINIDSLVTDPSAETLEECRFVIERKKVSISEILDNSGWYGQHSLESLSPLQATNTTDYDREEIGQDSSHNFEARLQQLIDVNTYYGELEIDGKLQNIVGIWSDDFVINTMDSPYPESWRHPFDGEPYTRVSGSIYGESIAELLSVNQKIRTGLSRAILDNLNAGTNGQKGVRKGVLDIVNKRKFASGENFEYLSQGGLDVFEGQFADTPPSVYELLDRVQQDSEELSGISRMNGGLDPRALNSGVSATASSLVNTAAERRLLLITRHISSLLENVFRKWLSLNQLMLESGSVRVANEMIDLSNLDLQGNYDLSISVATTGQKQQKSQQLSMVLQQLSQNPAIPQSMIMRLTSELVGSMDMYAAEEELLNLSKQMQLQEQQPQQPDPQQEMAMQLELQAKQAATAKDQSVAQLNEAKAVNTYVETEKSSYGID